MGGYSNIDIHVDQFKAMRISTSGTLSISQRDYGVMGMASLYQPHLSYPIDLYLDEGGYSECTPLEYPPFTETSAYIIGATADYWNDGDVSFRELTNESLTITFTNIAESIYLNNREIYAVNNIGRCSGYIQNNVAGGSQLVFTDMDCQLTYDEINKWCILMNTGVGLPMWENISIYITDLTIELRT